MFRYRDVRPYHLQLNVSLTAGLTVRLQRFNAHIDVLASLVDLDEGVPLEGGRGCEGRIYNVDSAGIVPRSPVGFGGNDGRGRESVRRFWAEEVGEYNGDHAHTPEPHTATEELDNRTMGQGCADKQGRLCWRYRYQVVEPVAELKAGAVFSSPGTTSREKEQGALRSTECVARGQTPDS